MPVRTKLHRKKRDLKNALAHLLKVLVPKRCYPQVLRHRVSRLHAARLLRLALSRRHQGRNATSRHEWELVACLAKIMWHILVLVERLVTDLPHMNQSVGSVGSIQNLNETRDLVPRILSARCGKLSTDVQELSICTMSLAECILLRPTAGHGVLSPAVYRIFVEHQLLRNTNELHCSLHDIVDRHPSMACTPSIGEAMETFIATFGNLLPGSWDPIARTWQDSAYQLQWAFEEAEYDAQVGCNTKGIFRWCAKTMGLMNMVFDDRGESPAPRGITDGVESLQNLRDLSHRKADCGAPEAARMMHYVLAFAAVVLGMGELPSDLCEVRLGRPCCQASRWVQRVAIDCALEELDAAGGHADTRDLRRHLLRFDHHNDAWESRHVLEPPRKHSRFSKTWCAV